MLGSSNLPSKHFDPGSQRSELNRQPEMNEINNENKRKTFMYRSTSL